MKLFITHKRVDHAIPGILARTMTTIDDLVKSKISPPLAGGDEGEGDRYHVEISQFSTLTPTLSRRGRGGIFDLLREHHILAMKRGI